MSYIIHTLHGSYCSVCQSPLTAEEVDWDECDACGGEGIWGDDDEPFDEDEPSPAHSAKIARSEREYRLRKEAF